MLLFRPGNLAILALAAGMIRCAYGAVVYDESINGDLSNSGLSPTVVSMALGSNQVWGTVGTANGVDLDYFTFTIQAGLQLSSITVLPGTQSGGALSFIGLQSGSQVTVPSDTQTAAGLLGWWHYSPSDINTDILAKMATPAMGSTGFTPPLPSGSYSLWIQDINATTVPYGFDFDLTSATSATPEPGTCSALLVGFAVLGAGILRRRRQSKV